jgi:crotonobetainyl-CoA:carnitine CoA-transferase CaiB-like acyl-CoA transferase
VYDVMEGVRVVEVAEHTFVPAASMILADWGADVIKVERAADGGDASRSMRVIQTPGLRSNPFFEAANRNKRGIGLDLTSSEGREILYELVEGADVFITNMRDSARAKMGINAEDLMGRNPALVYASGTGYGKQGPMAAARGFDYPSSWCRSGSAFVQTPPDGTPPPSQPGSVGDLTGGATLAGAISAALFRRERTGKGAVVDHALYMMGTYIMSQSLIGASLGRQAPEAARPSGPRPSRAESPDPLNNMYLTSDGRWLVLCLLYDQWWPDLARTVGHAEWLEDSRYAKVENRLANNVSLIAELDAIFATKTLAEWEEALANLEGVWAPLKSPAEVIDDQQALANGFVTPVSFDDGGSYLTGAPPAQFDGRPIGDLKASPTHGEHTDDVMRELGMTDERIANLRSRSVLA